MSLSVIGAGFGRTGTMSLKNALEQLGLMRRSGQRVVFVAPFEPAFAPPTRTAAGAQVREALTLAARARFETGRRALLRTGVPVVDPGSRAGTEDSSGGYHRGRRGANTIPRAMGTYDRRSPRQVKRNL